MSHPIRSSGRACRQLALVVAGAALVACASAPPPPVAELQAARQAIANAEQARAAEHAPLQLREARERLDAANNAVENEETLAAHRLAEQSRVLAELAFAKAEMEDARKVNEEIVRSTAVLMEEMQRRTGGTQ